MSFNFCKGTANSFIAISVLFFSMPSLANSNTPSITGSVIFTAKPTQCVALRQGRTCYAQIKLNWQVSDVGEYCIYEKNSNELVQCWHSTRLNTAMFDFQSKKRVDFILVKKGKKNPIAETFVDVSWVHKSTPRKRRWRLF